MVFEDVTTSRDESDSANKHTEAESSEFASSYRCPRLNRRLQSRYRQFSVSSSGSAMGDQDEQGVSSNRELDGGEPEPDRSEDLSPGTEIDVESPSVLEEGLLLESDQASSSRAEAGQAQEAEDASESAGYAGSQYHGRQGLSAIFATESDLSGGVQSTGQGEQFETDEQQGEGHGELLEPDGEDRRLVPRDEPKTKVPQGEIVWKSFPKPLRGK